MGEKGAKSGPQAKEKAEAALGRLEALGDVASRGMFGGVGLFESGKMFALVNTKGELYFKANDDNRERFVTAGAPQHGKMPYFRVPEEVMADDARFVEWAAGSIAAAHA